MNIFFKNRKENLYFESFDAVVAWICASSDTSLGIDYVITSDKEKTGKFFLDERLFLYWIVSNYIWRRRNSVKETESFKTALEFLLALWDDANVMPQLIPEGDFLKYEPDIFRTDGLTIQGHQILFHLSQSGFSEASLKVVKKLLSALIFAAVV